METTLQTIMLRKRTTGQQEERRDLSDKLFGRILGFILGSSPLEELNSTVDSGYQLTLERHQSIYSA
jgi:hypothetical protein